jgi:amino acid transporter
LLRAARTRSPIVSVTRPRGPGAGDPDADLSTEWDRSAAGQRSHLTALQGIPALCLDAMSSVAYGPQAVATILITAGAAAVSYTLPILLVIVLLLGVLTLSYTQVIRVASDGGGSYAIAKMLLGQPMSMLAAASLIVDYVLTVAVSLSAGAEALSSAFPALQSHDLIVCLIGLFVLTALNLIGISESAKVLVVPTLLFLVAVYATIFGDLVRSHPAAILSGPDLVHVSGSLGILLVLKAFSSGCSAVTGVEAVANGTPAFRDPKVKRAQRTEMALGFFLGTMLLGLGFAFHHLHPSLKSNVTLLSQLTAAAVGKGIAFYLSGIVVAIVLGVAANTSFGGLPILLSLLARDNRVPHVFALRAQKPVYRYGVISLAVLAAALLVAGNANTNALIPLYGIGVFTGFTISQVGLVRHWWRERSRRWRMTLGLNAFGAVLSGVAAVVLLGTKFTSGAWVAAVAIGLFIFTFTRIETYYRDTAEQIGIGLTPEPVRPLPSIVVVPVLSINRMTAKVVAAARSMGQEVVAVSVQPSQNEADGFTRAWSAWNPGIRLEILVEPHRTLVSPLVAYVTSLEKDRTKQVIVLISELTPHKRRHEVLHNQRGKILSALLRQRTDAVIATLPFRIND